MTIKLEPELLRSLLRQMLLIRRTEEQVVHFARDHRDLIRGHYHVYIGQEATGVGVCAALRSDDSVFTTHRNHGHVLARGGQPGPVLAEILGRVTGYNGGRGGTFHIMAPHLGILHTSAIVGGSLPLAAGAAFSIKKRGTDQVSVAFFGDGVLEEGAFYEAVNLAALWKLPVLFVCENNRVPADRRRGGPCPSRSHAARQLVDVARAFNIGAEVVDGADLIAVSALSTDLIARIRQGEGPFFIEARITPWPGNRGLFPQLDGGDFETAWIWDVSTAPSVLREWLLHNDPLSLLARSLVEHDVLSRHELDELDGDVKKEVADAVRFALTSPEPAPTRALEHILA